MPETTFIALNQDDWTEVSLSDSGQISNITDTLIAYIQSERRPDPLQVTGHHLTPHEVLRFTLQVPGKIFMRSIRGKAEVALSSGLTFGAPLTEIKAGEVLPVEQEGTVFNEMLDELKIINAHLSLITENDLRLGDF